MAKSQVGKYKTDNWADKLTNGRLRIAGRNVGLAMK